MGSKTAQRVYPKFREKVETSDKPLMVNQHGRENSKTELGNPWMDKLLLNRKNEKSAYPNRRTFTDKDANRYLETVEDKPEKILGTKKTGSTGMDGKTVCRICRPLSGGC